MLIAGSVDLELALAELARVRPVFHSEADFQLALGWHIQRRDPLTRVRLETRPRPGVHLDLAFARPDLDRSTAVELKYLTRAWSGEVDGERYELKDHGAQDIRGYDVVKDIHRVERFITGRTGADGAVVVLSNDASYWRPGAGDKDTNAAAFRLGEGTVLFGTRAWEPRTGAGTRKGREEALDLLGRYETRWADYSVVPGAANRSTFRQLVIEIAGSQHRS
jgi:hypothetical protein